MKVNVVCFCQFCDTEEKYLWTRINCNLKKHAISPHRSSDATSSTNSPDLEENPHRPRRRLCSETGSTTRDGKGTPATPLRRCGWWMGWRSKRVSN